MGSYHWGYKSPNMGYTHSYPTSNPLITTPEPPSMQNRRHNTDYTNWISRFREIFRREKTNASVPSLKRYVDKGST